MNIPQSTIDPFGYTGIPSLHRVYHGDEEIRAIVTYARETYRNIQPPILEADIQMIKVLLWKKGAQDVRISYEKEEFERGHHYLSFRVDGEPGIIGCRLRPDWL